MHDILILSLVAGILAVDDRAGWQSLLGEPVFSAAIVGAVTHQMTAALAAGVALQFAWFSIGAARGTRRANVVVGGVVGTGAACLVLKTTGDLRTGFVVASAVFFGLLAGEAGAVLARAGSEVRERWLGRFRLPPGEPEASRSLATAVIGSAVLVGVIDAVAVLVMLPVAAGLTDAFTGRMGGVAPGTTVWLAAVPALAAAVVIRAFSSRTWGRYAVLGFLVAVGAAWLL